MKPNPKSVQSGFTLVELAVVLAIVAILYKLAVISFGTWIANTQVRTAAESIQNALQLARAEAIRRNAGVTFWLISTTTPLGADWLVGCAVPVGTGSVPENPGDCPGISNTGQLATAGTATLWIQQASAAQQQSTMAQVSTANGGSGTEVTFNSIGMVTNNPDGSVPVTEFDITETANTSARPLEVLVSGGQIRMCDPALSLSTDPRGCQ